jgi:histidinol-phosphate phosphatase family protein
MKAVILAGGKGTRMNELSENIPKSMLKIADKPVIEHQIELLKKYGITDIHIIVNHLKDVIKDYLQNGEKQNVSISWFEEPLPLGTVGGIKEIEEHLKEDFLVLYGDVMINMELNRFIRFHNEKQSECTIVLHPNNHPHDSDLVETGNDGRITSFHPKPHTVSGSGYRVSGNQYTYYRNLVSAGAYILSPAIFKYLEKGKKSDFGRDVFPKLVSGIEYQVPSNKDKESVHTTGLRMYGYNTAEYLKDMGTPERLAEVQKDYSSGKFSRLNYENRQKAVFMDRDGVINKEKNFISRPEQLELFDFTADAIRMINDSDYLALIASNQSVVARNLCSIADVEMIHNKLETELGKKGAKIDRIYYCPHHPDKGYPEENKDYKIDCDCRKPKTGMFRQAMEELNVDAAESFMIGDSERDILFGKNAGMRTIGVETGYGLKNSKVKPDYFFKDLKEAISFLLKEC